MKLSNVYALSVEAASLALILLIQPVYASTIQVHEENDRIYYAPFNKICTASEIKQFVGNLSKKEKINKDHENFMYEELHYPPLSHNGDEGYDNELKYKIRDEENKLKFSLNDRLYDKEYELKLISCGKSAVPEMISLLRSGNREKIKAAIYILTGIGPDAEEAVLYLIDILNNYDIDIKIDSIKAIASIGPAAKAAVPVLITFLNNNEIGHYVAFALGKIGPAAKEAIPELLKRMKKNCYSSDIEILTDIVDDETFVDIVDNSRIVECIFSESYNVKKLLSSVKNLIKVGKGAKTIPAIVNIINYGNSELAEEAIKIFFSLKQDSLPAIPALVKILKTGHQNQHGLTNVQDRAATVLSHIGAPAVPYLIQLLSDSTDDKYVRARTLLALGEIGSEARAAAPYIRQLLQQGSISQLLAIITLADIGVKVETETILPALFAKNSFQFQEKIYSLIRMLERDKTTNYLHQVRRKLRHQDSESWYKIAIIMAELRIETGNSLPILLSALGYKGDAGIQKMAYSAIYKIVEYDKTTVIPYLRQLLQKNDGSQLYVAIILAELGIGTEDALPVIFSALHTSQDIETQKKVFSVILKVLNKNTVEIKNILPILIKLLETKDHTLGSSVSSSIGKLGKSAISAVPSLVKHYHFETLLDIGNTAALSFVFKCIKNDDCRYVVEEKGLAAIPVLIESLQNTDADMRHWAASVLAKIGKDAVPALLPMLQNKDSAVRREAIYALGKMKIHPVEAIPSLERILHESRNLDDRRLAASVLYMMGYDTAWFFSQNNFISPRNAACPLSWGKYEVTSSSCYLYSSFDFYTGQCQMLYFYKPGDEKGSISGIIHGLADFFSDDDNSDGAAQEAHDAVKQQIK